MNENFESLLTELREIEAISVDELVDALYVLRAHRSLSGIVAVCRSYLDLCVEYPDLRDCPGFEGYSSRLNVLERIASLTPTDSNLMGLDTQRYDASTPLRPLTGDSSICDILLIDCAGDAVQDEQYRKLVAWFIWQVQQFQIQNVDPDHYRRYMVEGIGRLITGYQASRVYNAFLTMRAFADPLSRGGLARMDRIGLEMDTSQSRLAAIAARFRQLSSRRSRNRLAAYAIETFGYTDAQLSSARKQFGNMPGSLALLLLSNWLPDIRTDHNATGGGSRKGQVNYRPCVRRSRYLTEMVDRIDEGGIHGGTVIELFIKPELTKEQEEDRDREDDDPDDLEETEPDISVFLGDKPDLLQSYYAAKGMQCAIEYDNAMLAWSRSTLSQEALSEIVGLVCLKDNEGPEERMARLAIGVALISGRAVQDVAALKLGLEMPWLSEHSPVGINVTEHALVVVPAKPKILKRVLDEFCYAPKTDISLPLPDAWRTLVASFQVDEKLKQSSVVEHARRLLGDLAPHLRVSEKGLRGALRRELAECSRGDLGMLKAITDADGANLRNIIHYASYDVAELETLWRAAAQALVGRLAPSTPPTDIARVGAIHAFDTDKLRSHFVEIQGRIRDARDREDWIRAYNLLTLYLSYWLGLAAAGRKTREPVPRVVLMGNWAVVADKSRADGSTDRLVPLTDTLLAQLQAYFALASMLSVISPALEPLQETEHGYEIKLLYIKRDGEVIAYRPKYQESHQNLTPLPANWARKVVRSESGAFAGRYRDAGMGHWVRGRHPWRQTSTFNVDDFKTAWLQLQTELEARLGFEVITINECHTTRREVTKVPALSRRKGDQADRAASKTKTPAKEELDEILMAIDAKCHDIIFNDTDPEPTLALQLVQRTMRKHPHLPREEQKALAIALCDHIRTATKIPLFGMRPRPLFSRDWVLNSAALQTLAYIDTAVLPALWRDLACLPARGDKDETQWVELGRLVMIGIWRLGLARFALLDAWLKALSRDAPILATGPIRYIVLQVPNKATGEPMRRTVLLDDFSSTYLLVEREHIAPTVAGLFEHAYQRRRSQVERAMRHYLKSIGIDHNALKIADMTSAAVQWFMLQTSPLVAGYAAGQFFTQDIDDAEFRRLAGFSPVRKGLKEIDPGHVVDIEYPVPQDTELPDDLTLRGHHWLAGLLSRKGKLKQEWQRLIRLQKAESPEEKLLLAYALWLLDAAIKAGEGARFTTRELNNYQNRLRIVGHALFGFAEVEPGWRRIEEDTLETLAELSADHFPDRAHHGAWYRFHAFLRDKEADHAGFEVGRLGYNSEYMVSAKILSQAEIEGVATLLPSARSGIGNPSLRISAARHFDLIATYGMRRAEAEKLRCVDVQGNLMRIQPYGEHGLKTAWSERVLPLAFAPPRPRRGIQGSLSTGQDRIIDPDAQTRADGNNFFDSLNRLIKTVTGDENLGSHHLRHTVASRLVLSLMARAIDLPGVFADIPWVEDLLIDDDYLQVLLGSEGDAGQGMQAVSAMLGHSHPTTTLRHYVHLLCIVLFAGLRKVDTLSMERSFEQRVASRTSIQNWARASRESAHASSPAGRCDKNRDMRERIEHYLGSGVHVDDTPLDGCGQSETKPQEATQSEQATISFDRLEAVDRALRDGEATVEQHLMDATKAGLAGLAAVPTGKRGSAARRHPMEEQGDGVFLPPRIAAGTATQAAVDLCDWLEALRCDHGEDFAWLLDKWVYSSESERGRMRLDGDEEVTRAERLQAHQAIEISLDRPPQSKKRKPKKSQSTRRMRIRCLDKKGKPITRDTGAVRWVMSHVAAVCLPAEGSA